MHVYLWQCFNLYIYITFLFRNIFLGAYIFQNAAVRRNAKWITEESKMMREGKIAGDR